MKTAVALSLAVAVARASAQVVDFRMILSEAPAFSSAKPIPTTSTNTKSIAFSIESRLQAAHAQSSALPTISEKPLSSTKKVSAAPQTTLKRTTKKTTKKTTTKRKTTTKKKAARKPAKVVKHRNGKRQATSTSSSASGACVSQPVYCSYVPSPNNATGFLTDSSLRSVANNALAPAGLTQAFALQFGSLLADKYLGYYQLSSYNISQCAALCTAYSGCTAINTYFERDPTVNPGPGCNNPTSIVSIRCALWGSTISAAQALDIGEWRTDFMVVIQGSNGYTINTPPPAQTNFTGPTAYAGAVATSAGTSFLSSSFQSGAYDVSFCAAACQSLTAQNRAGAIQNQTSNYQACNFFNTFKVSYNGSLAGTYCKMYTDSSVTAFANQYTSTTSSGTVYDLTYSYGYSLSTNDSGILPPGSFTKTSSTMTATATAGASQTPAAANLQASCSQINSTGTFVDSNNVTYQVKCSYDLLNVGDLSSRSVSSFAACFAACDTVSGCQAIAFVQQGSGGVCYFKSLKGVTTQPNANSAVDLAWQQGSYPAYKGSTTTTSSSAAATTTK